MRVAGTAHGRFAHMNEQARGGPHWQNVQVSSPAIGLLWEFPTSFYSYASPSRNVHIKT